MTVYVVSHENVSKYATRYLIVGVYSSAATAQAAINLLQNPGKTSTSCLEQYRITPLELQP